MLKPTRIMSIDLNAQPTAIENLGGYAEVRGLVCAAGMPLAWVRLPVRDGRVSAEAVAGALAAERQRARAAAATRTRSASFAVWPSVTVAVCTRDRPDELARCLAALRRVQYGNLELLVVDNAPSDDRTADLVRAGYPEVRYVREPRPGLDWARNRAVAEARSDVIAFTDDDALPAPTWVRALTEVFAEDPGVMAVTGLVVPVELDTTAQVLFERYRSFARGFSRRRIPGARPGETIGVRAARAGDFGTGANMAFRRALFARVGLFDPALDVGTVTNGGGDLDMFFRVLKEGHVLVYEPRAVVWHRHRRTLPELHRQIGDHGISFASYLVRTAIHYPDERLALARLGCWWLAKMGYRALVPLRTPHTPLRRLAFAELRGFLQGMGRYRRARAEAARIAAHHGEFSPS